jgi:hypothetical protein
MAPVNVVMAASMDCSRALTAAPTHAILAAGFTDVVDVLVSAKTIGTTAAKPATASDNAIIFLFIKYYFIFFDLEKTFIHP